VVASPINQVGLNKAAVLARPRPRLSHRLVVCAALLLAMWLILAGTSKLVSPTTGQTIADHGVVPRSLAGVVTLAVATVEIGTGGTLLVGIAIAGRALSFGMAASGALFLTFALYAIWLTLSPPAQPSACGCGIWHIQPASWPFLAARNGLIASPCLSAVSLCENTLRFPNRVGIAIPPGILNDRR